MTRSIPQDTLDGWFFAQESRKLGYGDNRAIVIGRTHRVRGALELCKHGLHASDRAIDALSFAPGPIVYRVKLSGSILRGDDKACASARTYIAGGADATDVLCAFARWCALEVAHLWDMPPIVRQYLETGDKSISAAAWAATRDAAWAATRDAFIDRANAELERRLSDLLK